jgi:hypothetical protein
MLSLPFTLPETTTLLIADLYLAIYDSRRCLTGFYPLPGPRKVAADWPLSC